MVRYSLLSMLSCLDATKSVGGRKQKHIIPTLPQRALMISDISTLNESDDDNGHFLSNISFYNSLYYYLLNQITILQLCNILHHQSFQYHPRCSNQEHTIANCIKCISPNVQFTYNNTTTKQFQLIKSTR
jgi:hypothetical protein